MISAYRTRDGVSKLYTIKLYTVADVFKKCDCVSSPYFTSLACGTADAEHSGT